MTGPRVVAEVREERGDIPLWVHPEWAERFPGVVQGTTGAPVDMGLWGDNPAGDVLRRWLGLPQLLGARTIVHSLQVHGTDLQIHDQDDLPGGVHLLRGLDGHIATAPGRLLTVSVADCVPVFLHHPGIGAVCVVHSGWRGTAAGIVEGAIQLLSLRLGASSGELHLHCGPSICGECYEVGPEVHRAIHGAQAEPEAPAPIDLPRAIAARATGAGVPSDHVTLSAHCTHCGPRRFFSHRAGHPQRQIGLIGLRH